MLRADRVAAGPRARRHHQLPRCRGVRAYSNLDPAGSRKSGSPETYRPLSETGSIAGPAGPDRASTISAARSAPARRSTFSTPPSGARPSVSLATTCGGAKMMSVFGGCSWAVSVCSRRCVTSSRRWGRSTTFGSHYRAFGAVGTAYGRWTEQIGDHSAGRWRFVDIALVDADARAERQRSTCGRIPTKGSGCAASWRPISAHGRAGVRR